MSANLYSTPPVYANAIGNIPVKKSLALQLSFDFSAQSIFNYNLGNLIEQDIIDFIQGIYVDNSNNPSAVLINCPENQFTLKIPAYTQLYSPFCAGTYPNITLTSQGNKTVSAQFLNFPVAPVLIKNGVASNNLVAGQGNVTVAGTAINLPASVLSKGVTIKALKTNTGVLTIGNSNVNNIITGSGNGYQLASGESIFIECDNVNSIFINATVNNDGFSFLGN